MARGKRTKKERVWRLWVDARSKVVSFHQESGWQLLEFRNRELFQSCVDHYTEQGYRYQ